MSELFDLDVAWEQAVAARARGDTGAEATALTLLEQALYDDGRGKEASEVGRQVIELAKPCSEKRKILQLRYELWMRRGEWLEQTAGSLQPGGEIAGLEAAHSAYCQALSTLEAIGDGPELLREQARQRAEAVDRRRREQQDAADRRREREQAAWNKEQLGYDRYMVLPGPGPAHLAETIIVGFLAVKVLGPFLEAWAKKLGERSGESTARALGRIRIRHGKETQLEASVPGTHTPTVLVLPGQLSDSAKLAIIDLDPALEGVRGQTLYWCQSERAFLSLDGLFSAFRARHPEVTIDESGQSASWSDDDGPHTLSRGSMSRLWMIQYLETHFDR